MLLQPPIPYQVFTRETFQPVIDYDLERTVGRAVIESSYISHDGVRRFAPMIEALVRRGVRVCTFIQEPHDWHARDSRMLPTNQRVEFDKISYAVDSLRSLGAHCTLRPRTHAKIAVIDNRITWIGSINMLSYTKFTDEELYRWVDESWALDTMRRRKFDECPQCKENAVFSTDELTIGLDRVALGRQIEEMRKSLQLTQKDIADRVGVSRDVIYDIEKGNRYVKWDTLVKTYAALNRHVVAVTPGVLPMLARWMEAEARPQGAAFSHQASSR